MIAKSEAVARAYHHGDLRSALIEEALRLLEMAETAEPALLSLREIARNVGVSATAVYRHFPDKDFLLGALAERGFELLAKRQRAVALRARGQSAIAALGRAYVRFALENPGLYRLMFTHRAYAGDSLKDGPQGSAAWMLREQVAAALGPAATEQSVAVTSLRAWSLVHGLSMLILDRQVDRQAGEAMINALISVEAVGLG
jgi:AcrR family transcriptional regulator